MSAIDDLIETIRRLRAPDGCPWDREQNHQSLAQFLVDECSELLEAIDREDLPHMREELGDVLCQIVMHAQIADEAGAFSFADVARDINDKLVRRHPHVFGEEEWIADSEAVVHRWDQIKAQEKGRVAPKGIFKDLPPQLPALLYGHAVIKQVRKKKLETGDFLDWESVEALAASATEAEMGQALLRITAACQLAGIDPESALRRATSRLASDLEREHADGAITQ